MIKAIIFDCFGVLTNDSWKELVSTFSPDVRHKASELNHTYDAGNLTHQDFLSEVEKLTGTKSEDIDKVLDRESTKNLPLLNYIKDLRKTYKTSILSNIASDWITESFLSEDEQALFDDIVVSYKVGTTKPSPKMYQLAAERLSVKPGECIFIDDVENYCEAARQQGMQAFRYVDFQQMKDELERLLDDSKD